MLFANKCGRSVAATIKRGGDLFEFNFVTGAELLDGGRTEEAERTGRHHNIFFDLDPFLFLEPANQYPERDVAQHLHIHRSAGRAMSRGMPDVVCAVGVLAQFAEQCGGHERARRPCVVEYAVRLLVFVAEVPDLLPCIRVPVAAYGGVCRLLARDDYPVFPAFLCGLVLLLTLLVGCFDLAGGVLLGSDLASLGVDAGTGLSLTLDYFTCWFWWHYVNGRGILSVARLSSCRVDVLGGSVV